MSWTQWMQSRMTSAVLAVMLMVPMGTPSVFAAYRQTDELRPKGVRESDDGRRQIEDDSAWIYYREAPTPPTPRPPTLADLVRVRSQAGLQRSREALVSEAKEAVAKAFDPKEQRAFTIGASQVATDSHIPGVTWDESTQRSLAGLADWLTKSGKDLETVAVTEGKVVLTPKKGEKLVVDNPVAVSAARFANQWANLRREQESGERVSDKEVSAAFQDLVNTIWLLHQTIETIDEPEIKTYLLSQVRLVPILEDTRHPEVVRALREEAELVGRLTGVQPPMHYEYGRGVPWLLAGDQDVNGQPHAFLTGYAGRHRGLRSIYTSVARTRRYVERIRMAEQAGDTQGAGQVRQAFKQWLIHEAKDSQRGHHEDEPEAVATVIDAGERLVLQDYEEEQARRIEQIYAEDRNRFTETFVTVDLGKVFGVATQLPEEIVAAIEAPLLAQMDRGVLNDVVVKRFGEVLVLDLTHNGPIYDLDRQQVVADALRAGFVKAAEVGSYVPENIESGVDLRTATLEQLANALDWHTDDVRYTRGPNDKRKSQPTLRQFIFGGDERAFNTILFNLYASPNYTTMQPIEGSPGMYFVNQQVAGLRHDTFTQVVRGNQLDASGRKAIVMHLPNALFEQVNLNKGPDPSQGEESGYATQAVFAGKGGRYPTDEPLATVLNLGKVQVAVYQSQAGAEAVGGILAVGARQQTVDGEIGGQPSRLDLQPVTWEEAATLTTEALAKQRIAPTTFIGSQMNRGRFGEVLDPVKESPEFEITDLVRQVKPEMEFDHIFQSHWPIQPATSALQATSLSVEAWHQLQRQGQTDAELRQAGLQQTEAIPDKRAALARWAHANQTRDGLTVSIFKADIGSSLGHTIPPQLLMTLMRAYMGYAKSRGWIIDYLVQEELPMFRVGDDIEIVISHEHGIDEREMHGLANRAFYFALYFAQNGDRDEYYGFAQDVQTDVDFFLQFARLTEGDTGWRNDANLNELMADYALPMVQSLNREDRHTITPAEIAKASSRFAIDVKALQEGTYQSPKGVKSSVFDASGNTKGSGLGSAELPLSRLAPGRRSYMFLAFDKASPGAFSLPYVEGALAALKAGDYENLLFEVDVVKPITEHGIGQETMLVDIASQPELVKQVLASVNEFQIKAIWTRERDGSLRMVVVNSTERLYQSEKAQGAYLGKDDPAAVLDQAFGNHVVNWLAEHPYILQGDERGSHWKFALPVSAVRSSPGTYSIPVVVAVSFSVGQQGQLQDVVDIFGDPKFKVARARAVAGNELLVDRHGNDPRRGAIADIEEAYPGRRNYRAIVKQAQPVQSLGASLAEHWTGQFGALKHHLSMQAIQQEGTVLLHPAAFAQGPDLAIELERYRHAGGGMKLMVDAESLVVSRQTAKSGEPSVTVTLRPKTDENRVAIREGLEELRKSWVRENLSTVTITQHSDAEQTLVTFSGELAQQAAARFLQHSAVAEMAAAEAAHRLFGAVNTATHGAAHLEAAWFNFVFARPSEPVAVALGPSDWAATVHTTVKAVVDDPGTGQVRSSGAALVAGIETVAADGRRLPTAVAKRLDVDITEAGAIVPNLQPVGERFRPQMDAYRTTVSETVSAK